MICAKKRIMLIKQPTLAVERKEEKREEGYKGLHSGLTITGLDVDFKLDVFYLWCSMKQSVWGSPVWHKCIWHSWQYHDVSRRWCCLLFQQNQQRPRRVAFWRRIVKWRKEREEGGAS